MDSGKKKKWKRKLFRCTKGAISILLCLVMAPFLSVSLGLVEYARYQQVIELVDELEELTGISLLSDYDQYIHNRFGLLAVSQKQNLNSVATEYMQSNIGAVGSQATFHSASVSGGFALNDPDVIKHQILDVAELTGLSQVLMEDFNLEVLLEKLDKLQGIQKVTNTVNGIANLTSALSTAVTKAEELQQKLDIIVKAASPYLRTEDANGNNIVVNPNPNSLKAKAESLADHLDKLFTKLKNNGYTVPANISGEALDEILISLTGEYQEDVTQIYGKAKEIIAQVNDVKSAAGAIPGLVTDLESSINKVVTEAGNIGKESGGEGGAVADQAGSTLNDVVNQMKGLISGTLDELKGETVKTIKDTASKIVDEVLESTGLANAYARYPEILDGTYFKSDVGKQDLKEIIALIPAVWNSGSPDAALEALKNKFVPSFDSGMSIDLLANKIKNIVVAAKNALVTKVDNGGFDLLTKLVNIIRKLFHLKGIYDAELNANVILSPGDGSIYQTFLKHLGNALNAVEKFKSAMQNFDFFKAIEAIGTLCSSVGEFFSTLGSLVEETINNIDNLLRNGLNGLYERLLLAGYATHNFPNRTSNAIELEGEANGALSTVRLTLKGQGITGFDYNQIARPYTYVSQSIKDGSMGVSGLNSVLTNLTKQGTDTMFKGAEMEYVVAGTSSELANQILCFFNLYFLRLLCNLPAVFVDAEVQTMAATCNIACWVVYILYALIEPFCDSLLLVNGETVPIVKTDCYLTPTGLRPFLQKMAEGCMGPELVTEFNNALGTNESVESIGTNNKTGGSGLGASLMEVDYGTHLLIMTLISNKPEDTVRRIQTLVQLETAEYYRQKNVTFDWNKTYTAVTVTANVDFNSFFDLGILNGDGPLRFNTNMKQPVGY